MEKASIEKFQKLYQKRYGIELSEKEAQDLGTRLLSLLRVTCSPLSKEEFEAMKEIKPFKE